jgi:hypothetical protein
MLKSTFTLFCLICLICLISCSNDSSINSGNPNPPAPEDSTVILISPSNGFVYYNFNSGDSTVTYTWHKTANASMYELQVAGDSTFTYPYIHYLTDTTFTVKLTVPPQAPFNTYWRVRIQPQYYLLWSEVWHYTISP